MGLGVVDIPLGVERAVGHLVDDALVVGHLVDGVHHLSVQLYVLHHGFLRVAVHVLLVGREAELRLVAHLVNGIAQQILGLAVLVEAPEVVYLQRVALCGNLAVRLDAKDTLGVVALHDVERGLCEVGEHLLGVVVVYALFRHGSRLVVDFQRVGPHVSGRRHVHLLAHDELYAAQCGVGVALHFLVGIEGDALDGVLQRGQQG